MICVFFFSVKHFKNALLAILSVKKFSVQLTAPVEHADYISAEGQEHPKESTGYDTKQCVGESPVSDFFLEI